MVASGEAKAEEKREITAPEGFKPLEVGPGAGGPLGGPWVGGHWVSPWVGGHWVSPWVGGPLGGPFPLRQSEWGWGGVQG